MKSGTVVKPIVAAKRLWEAPSGALLIVDLDPPLEMGQEAPGAPAEEQLIAFDLLGCGVGERVLVAVGPMATAWFPGKAPPVDALIIAAL